MGEPDTANAPTRVLGLRVVAADLKSRHGWHNLTSNNRGSLAQLVEHRTFNPMVAGSNPARPNLSMADTSGKSTDKQPAANFRAFTLKADKPLRRIQFNVGVTRVVVGDQGVPQSQHHQCTAILDTAAERTRVSRKVIEALALTLEGAGGNGHPAHYRVDVYLPNMIRFTDVPVTEMPPRPEGNVDCLIGMDILSCADCSLSHKDRKMMFSLRVPPLGSPDFVEEHQRLHRGKARMVTTAATRNQSCPCGSGKRFKNCCGKIY